jgi:hypothetical protein
MLNPGLKRTLLVKEKAHPEFRSGGRYRSNQGGWRSEPDPNVPLNGFF